MHARDVAGLIAYGAALIVATWIVTAACVRAGWVLPPGERSAVERFAPP